MSTRSQISVKMDDGTYLTTYVHWDGYLSGVGKALLHNFTEKEKVIELISNGWLSYIENDGTFEVMDDAPEPVTQKELKLVGGWLEYAYLFEGKWKYQKIDGLWKHNLIVVGLFSPLTEELVNV